MIKSPNTILRLCKSRDVKIVVEDIGDNHLGYVYIENKVIHIDKHQQIKQRVSTLIHECLHILNPKAHEYTIAGIERDTLEILSKKQYNELSKLVV